jgi:hypothetical protein
MNKRGDQRAQELNNLKLASATFALRLDTFEARVKCQRLRQTPNCRSWARRISVLRNRLPSR